MMKDIFIANWSNYLKKVERSKIKIIINTIISCLAAVAIPFGILWMSSNLILQIIAVTMIIAISKIEKETIIDTCYQDLNLLDDISVMIEYMLRDFRSSNLTKEQTLSYHEDISNMLLELNRINFHTKTKEFYDQTMLETHTFFHERLRDYQNASLLECSQPKEEILEADIECSPKMDLKILYDLEALTKTLKELGFQDDGIANFLKIHAPEDYSTLNELLLSAKQDSNFCQTLYHNFNPDTAVSLIDSEIKNQYEESIKNVSNDEKQQLEKDYYRHLLQSFEKRVSDEEKPKTLQKRNR